VCSVAEDVYAQVTALPAARERDIRLERNGPVRIVADGERLHQVLLNLLANAVEHIPPGGQATLSIEPTTCGARFEVRDNGGGIPSDHLAHIFDRFYRADGARHRGGAGLGLAIARAIVEAHGGRIQAANLQNGGASFSVELPSLA
jgi:two-component system, OmpR family, sensor kinase